MEKLAGFLIGLTLVCFALAVLTVIAIIIKSNKVKSNIGKLLSSNERGGDFVYRLLRTTFPASKILRSAVLPLDNGQRAVADIILVDCGGVFVIRVKNFPGKIILEYSPESFTGTELDFARSFTILVPFTAISMMCSLSILNTTSL